MSKKDEIFLLSHLPKKISKEDIKAAKPLSFATKEGRYAKLSVLSKMVSPHRFIHSLSVGSLCKKAAAAQGLDAEKALIIGIFHDCGKGIGKKKEKALMRRYFPEYKDYPEWTFHQFTGSLFAKELFGFEDSEILDAICFHATGKPDMGIYGKLVYACDKIDPLRGYDSSDMIESVMKDIDAGFVYVLRENREFYKAKGFKPDNELTITCFEHYLDSMR